MAHAVHLAKGLPDHLRHDHSLCALCGKPETHSNINASCSHPPLVEARRMNRRTPHDLQTHLHLAYAAVDCATHGSYGIPHVGRCRGRRRHLPWPMDLLQTRHADPERLHIHHHTEGLHACDGMGSTDDRNAFMGQRLLYLIRHVELGLKRHKTGTLR